MKQQNDCAWRLPRTAGSISKRVPGGSARNRQTKERNYVKFESEAGELKWQNQFLKKLGLREKERKAVLTGQMKIFAVLPLIIGTCGGILFGGLSVKARLYDAAALRSFLLTGAVVYLIYIGIWIIWYLWIKKLIWRQAEWEK